MHLGYPHWCFWYVLPLVHASSIGHSCIQEMRAFSSARHRCFHQFPTRLGKSKCSVFAKCTKMRHFVHCRASKWPSLWPCRSLCPNASKWHAAKQWDECSPRGRLDACSMSEPVVCPLAKAGCTEFVAVGPVFSCIQVPSPHLVLVPKQWVIVAVQVACCYCLPVIAGIYRIRHVIG